MRNTSLVISIHRWRCTRCAIFARLNPTDLACLRVKTPYWPDAIFVIRLSMQRKVRGGCDIEDVREEPDRPTN